MLPILCLAALPYASYQVDSAACAESVAFARVGNGPEWFAAWWESRADRSAALMVARSVNGGESWSLPSVADARDHGTNGC